MLEVPYRDCVTVGWQQNYKLQVCVCVCVCVSISSFTLPPSPPSFSSYHLNTTLFYCFTHLSPFFFFFFFFANVKIQVAI